MQTRRNPIRPGLERQCGTHGPVTRDSQPPDLSEAVVVNAMNAEYHACFQAHKVHGVE